MGGVAEITIPRFILMYVLLLIVLTIMKRYRMKQSRQILFASLRMTVQLVLAGFVLTYIFKNPHPVFTMAYVACMIGFTIHRITSKNPQLNKKFRAAIASSVTLAGLAIICFFVGIVVHHDIFDPQYLIPMSGMIFGNIMTGVNLGVKSLYDALSSEKLRIETLLNIGGTPQMINDPWKRPSFRRSIRW